jgi:hypothetical protein
MGTFSAAKRLPRMRKMRLPTSASAILVAAAVITPASAQINNGPPVPPEQVFRQQATSPPPPPPPLQGPPPISAPFAGYGPVPNPPIDPNAGGRDLDRVAQCQHEAAVERVPRSKRAAYVHNCSIGY